MLENHLSTRSIHTSTAERHAEPQHKPPAVQRRGNRGAAIALPQHKRVSCRVSSVNTAEGEQRHMGSLLMDLGHYNQSVQPRY